MIMAARRAMLCCTALWLACGSAVAAGGRDIYTDDSGVAASGYDVVAYFDRGPVRGLPAFQAEYRGAVWYFANKGNQDMFRMSPAKFIPAYGGFCAYGVSRGYLVKTDPQAWSTHKGRLYLNFDVITRKHWLRDRENYIALADKNWPRLIK